MPPRTPRTVFENLSNHLSLSAVLNHRFAQGRYGRIRPDLERLLDAYTGPLDKHLRVRNLLVGFQKSIRTDQEGLNDFIDADRKKRQATRLLQHWDALEWLRIAKEQVDQRTGLEKKFLKEHLEKIVPDPESLFVPNPWDKIVRAEKKLQSQGELARYPPRPTSRNKTQLAVIGFAGLELLDLIHDHLETARAQGEAV